MEIVMKGGSFAAGRNGGEQKLSEWGHCHVNANWSSGMSVLTDSLEADDTINPPLLSYRYLDLPKGVRWYRVI